MIKFKKKVLFLHGYNKNKKICMFSEIIWQIKQQKYQRFLSIVKPITTESIKQMNLKRPAEIEIGAIAGSKSNLFLGRFLRGENDGRIRVKSVQYSDLKDFTVRILYEGLKRWKKKILKKSSTRLFLKENLSESSKKRL